MEEKSLEVGHHTTVFLGGIPLHTDTLLYTGIVCAVLIIIAALARRSLTSGPPKGLQNLIEGVYSLVSGMVTDSGADKVRYMAPMAITLFLFILFSNMLGTIPGLHSPTSDLNTPVALTLVVLFLMHYLGLKFKGAGGYLKHFAEPMALAIPINVLEIVTRPVSLALRLFGNMFAKGTVFGLIGFLLPWFLIVVPSIVWIPFSLFIGVIQAFVFTVLTIVYLGMAMETHPEGAH